MVCFALYHDNIWHSWEGVGGIIGSLLRHWVQVEWGGGRKGWVGDLLGSLLSSFYLLSSLYHDDI